MKHLFNWEYREHIFKRPISLTWKEHLRVCVSRRSRTRTRDVCRSNRPYNEMSACSLLMEKYWMNVSSIVLVSKGQPVWSRRAHIPLDGGTRPSADGENTIPSRFNAKQAYSGEVSSAPDTDSWNINLMIETPFARLSGLKFPSWRKLRNRENKSRVITWYLPLVLELNFVVTQHLNLEILCIFIANMWYIISFN